MLAEMQLCADLSYDRLHYIDEKGKKSRFWNKILALK
jgi:hypothetical protein